MEKALFWHRRDLRIEDNAGLYAALKSTYAVIPIFIFDTAILSKLKSNDQRVLFIYLKIKELKKEYNKFGSDLLVFIGNPVELIPELVNKYSIKAVFTNKDYEPYAIKRDKAIYDSLIENKVSFTAKKDHVIFEKNEILKQDGKPYTVFTPYMKRWKEKLTDFYYKEYPTLSYIDKLDKIHSITDLPKLTDFGFEEELHHEFPSNTIKDGLISKYDLQRDLPAINGTSKLSLHLRFGTISIRKIAKRAVGLNQVFLNELIWRDFYQMIIYHFPYSAFDSFKKQYDRINWENNELYFKAWCEGNTGYPLVDAGMRELNQTGFMHNRVRMVVASFLCKHLLIDWRWGERYFAEKLLDFELASNAGGWQWASGSGCDAAPYFRVFNPYLQQEKFDPNFVYVRRWVKEFDTKDYPKPIVDHKEARLKAIELYKNALT